MAWWRRSDRTRSGRRYAASLTRASYDGDAVVAAVQRFDLSNEGDRKKLGKLQRQWQENAWYYVDHVGELGYPYQFMANAFRRVRVYAGFRRDPEGDPIPVMDALRPETADEADADLPAGVEPTDIDDDDYLPPEVAELCRQVIDYGFSARDGGQEALMERIGGNLFLVGETMLVRRAVMTRRPVDIIDELTGERRRERPEEVPRVMDWEVRSVDELVDDTSRRTLVVREVPDQPVETCEPVIGLDGEEAFVERIWRKHGRWSQWAHSNVRPAMGVLDELDLLAKLARVAIRARILAGILTMPDEMEFPASEQIPGDEQPRRSVRFDRNLAEAMAAAIGNEADANSVVPMSLRGPKDLLGPDSVRIIEVPRRYSSEERAQYEDAVTRLARTLDLPVEIIKGMTDANHWSAWQIEDATYEAHVEPHVMVATEGLTYALLRPVLRDAGIDERWIDRLVVAADASRLIRRPNRGATATEGYGIMALSWDAWRRANGFDDGDAPSHDELVMRLAVQRSILTAELSALLLEQSGLMAAGTFAELQEQKAALGEGDQPAPVDDTPADDDTPPTEAGEPDDSADDEAVAAAATLARLVGMDARDVAAIVASAKRSGAGFALSTADRVLREHLQATTDAAVTRALERAGNKLRNRVRGDATARAALASAGDVRTVDVGRVLGPAVVAALVEDDDLFDGDTFDELHQRYDEWVSAAQENALDTVAAVAGDAFTSDRRRELEREQEEDRDEGWAVFLAALLAFARRRFTGDGDDGTDGEFDPTAVVPASIVREALAVAGGETIDHGLDGAVLSALDDGPVGGVSTGRLIRVTFGDLGFPWTGYTWIYGLAPRQTSFMPHAALDGVSFEHWDDDVLVNTGDWPRVSHYRPGDHLFCRCSFAPAIGQATAASAYAATTEEV